MTHATLVGHARAAHGQDWPLATMLAADLRCFHPDEPTGYEVGAAAARELGQFDDAMALLAEAAARFPDQAWPLREAAWTVRLRGDIAGAIGLASDLRTRFPTDPAGYRFGGVFLMQGNRLAEAEAVFRAASAQFPGETWPQREAAAMALRRRNRAAAAGLVAALQQAPYRSPAARGGGTVVVVLGMHRAGTSLCARILQRLGVSLGEPLLQPSSANPDGYQEHVEVVTCHELLLAVAEANFDTIRSAQPLPDGFWGRAAVAYARERLQTLVREQLAATGGAWAFKDPRTMRFLPIWRELFDALGVRPVWLLAVRSPAAVAASLQARDGIPCGIGELLWLEHYLDALRQLGPEIAQIVSYDRWFFEPEVQVRAMADAIGGVAEGAIAGAMDAVREDLRHHSAGLDATILVPARVLHARLLAEPPDLVGMQRDTGALWRMLQATARGLPGTAERPSG